MPSREGGRDRSPRPVPAGQVLPVIAERMRELGIVLPPPFPPAGNYVGCVVDRQTVWVGGHGPVDGERVMTSPAVIDGCSDLLVQLFGEAGRHTRAAVGMAELPFDIAVEIELVARIR